MKQTKSPTVLILTWIFWDHSGSLSHSNVPLLLLWLGFEFVFTKWWCRMRCWRWSWLVGCVMEINCCLYQLNVLGFSGPVLDFKWYVCLKLGTQHCDSVSHVHADNNVFTLSSLFCSKRATKIMFWLCLCSVSGADLESVLYYTLTLSFKTTPISNTHTHSLTYTFLLKITPTNPGRLSVQQIFYFVYFISYTIYTIDDSNIFHWYEAASALFLIVHEIMQERSWCDRWVKWVFCSDESPPFFVILQVERSSGRAVTWAARRRVWDNDARGCNQQQTGY